MAQCAGMVRVRQFGATPRAACRAAHARRAVRVACSGSGGSSGGGSGGAYRPLVKVCGVTNAVDAEVAAAAGASFIGMIMWPKAKRAVSDGAAAAIAAAARRHGAAAVGVFVDEDAATITRRCRAAGVGVAQLHGDGARAALQGIPSDLQVVYVLHASPEGEILTQLPAAGEGQRRPDWLLVDGQTGGSGQTYDWSNVRVPDVGARGWMLAGGLHPGNVADAVAAVRPAVVDVSSGVCGPDGLAKDHEKVRAFVAAALGAAEPEPAAR